MNQQVLFTFPLDEFEEIQKRWIRDVITEINSTAKPESRKPRETYGTRKEVAKELKISLPTLNELTKTGIIKSYRISGRVLYKWEEVMLAVTEVKTSKYRHNE
jgi:hypothetical protein